MHGLLFLFLVFLLSYDIKKKKVAKRWVNWFARSLKVAKRFYFQVAEFFLFPRLDIFQEK